MALKKKSTELVSILITCNCGQEHTLKSTDFSVSTSTGCESCGFGGGATLYYTCPVTKRYEDFQVSDY